MMSPAMWVTMPYGDVKVITSEPATRSLLRNIPPPFNSYLKLKIIQVQNINDKMKQVKKVNKLQGKSAQEIISFGHLLK